MLASGAK